MGALWLLLVLGVALFVATNLDDIFILLAFFADASLRPSKIVAGQLIGISVLFLGSALLSRLALVLASEYVGLLGLAPLFLGIKKLIESLRAKKEDDEDDPKPSQGASQIISVALVTIANGGDNLGVYIPAFTARSLGELAVFGVIFLLMTGLWCVAGYYLVNHPRLGAPIRRVARPVMPIILIVLGLSILIESKAYSLLPL